MVWSRVSYIKQIRLVFNPLKISSYKYRKAEFLHIAADTEKSHILKNLWLASLAMVPTYLAKWSNITDDLNKGTCDIWLSLVK